MAEKRKTVECAYCGAEYSIRFKTEEICKPDFCCFCGENGEIEEFDTDEDIDDFDCDDPVED
jgi:hypothetical protein